MYEKPIDRDIKGVIKVGQDDNENIFLLGQRAAHVFPDFGKPGFSSHLEQGKAKN